MTTKIKSMFSRITAQCLKSVFVILATLAVGGAWAAGWWQSGTDWSSVTWDGGSTDAYYIGPWSDVAMSFSELYNDTATLFVGQGDTSKHTVTFEAADSTKGLALTGGMTIAFPSNTKGDLVLNEGTYSVTGDINLGTEAGSTASLTVNDGASLSAGGNFNFAYGTSTLTIDGGTMTVSGASTWNWSANSTSQVTIQNGGSITISGKYDGTDESGMNVISGAYGNMTILVDNGTFEVSSGNAYIGLYGCWSGDEPYKTGTTAKGAGTITINNGGVFSVGNSTAGKTLYLSKYGAETFTVNVNQGGTLKAGKILRDNTDGTSTINLNGGTIQALSDNVTLINANVAVTVDSNGGTLDTNGKAITISSAVTGTGALRIIGGGVVTFTTAPTCGLNVENGVAVLPKNSAVGAITIGAHGVLAFDLTGETITSGNDYTLATVTSLTIPSGESYADSIFTIGPDFTSTIALDGTTLKATATSDATYTGNTANVRYITASAGGWIDDVNVWINIPRGPNGATNGNNGDHSADYNGVENRRDIVVIPNDASIYIYNEANHPNNFTIVNRAATLTLKGWVAVPTLILDNLSNTGTIVNGTGSGDVLRDFNLTVNNQVTAGGTITLNGGVLTFPAGSTFADISATSVSVTGDSIVTGDKLFTLTAAAPTFAISSVTTRLGATHFTNTEGVYTAGKKYYWVGGDTASPATTALSDTTKWASVDSTEAQYLTNEIPGPADIAVFASCAGSGAVLDADVNYNISIETNFTIWQETAATTYSIGTKNSSGVQDTFFDIKQGAIATLYAHSTSSSRAQVINLNSKLTGNGNLAGIIGNYYGNVKFYGDLSNFKGKVVCVSEHELRGEFVFGDDSIDASLSSWSLYDNGNKGQKTTFPTTAGKNTLRFGALNMLAYERSNNSIIGRTSIFYIGGRGEASRIWGTWPSSYKPTINWTDATATFTNAAANTAVLNITGGGNAYISSVPDKIGISSNGGWLVIDSANSAVASGIINNIDANSTDATLRFDVESAVAVDSVTSSAVLNNANGFTKKGLGSLTLTGNFTKLGEVNVTDGQLVIVSNSALTQGTDYTLGGATLCTVEGTTYTFGVGAASFNGQAYISIQAAVNDAAAAGQEIEKTVTLLRNAGEDVEIPVVGITINYGTYTNSGNVTGALGVDAEYNSEANAWVSVETADYIWCGGSGTSWNTPANWRKNAVPGTDDNVVFPSEGAPWTVALENNVTVASVAFDGAVSLSGAIITTKTISGAATVTLGDSAGFCDNGTDNLAIANISFIVTASESNPAVFRDCAPQAAAQHLNIANSVTITGDGAINFETLNDSGSQNGIGVSANMIGFEGTVSFPSSINGYNGPNYRDNAYIGSSTYSEKAKWIINNSTRNGSGKAFFSNGGTYKFGSLTGSPIHDSTDVTYTLEVGKLGVESESLSGRYFRSDAYSNLIASRGATICKVGSGTLLFTGNLVHAYDINEGTLCINANASLQTFWDSNSKNKYSATRVNENDEYYTPITFTGDSTLELGDELTVDPTEHNQIVLTEGVSFAISTAQSRTFANAFGSGTTANFTKKGAGSLTLSQRPAYSGVTTVEEGELYVPEGTTLTRGNDTHKVPSDKAGYDKYIHTTASGFLFMAF